MRAARVRQTRGSGQRAVASTREKEEKGKERGAYALTLQNFMKIQPSQSDGIKGILGIKVCDGEVLTGIL